MMNLLSYFDICVQLNIAKYLQYEVDRSLNPKEFAKIFDLKKKDRKKERIITDFLILDKNIFPSETILSLFYMR